MVDMIRKVIAPYFVANNGIYEYKDKDGKDKTMPDWWGAIVCKNATDAPQKTSLLIKDFYTDETLKVIPIVLAAGEGKIIINTKKDGDNGDNLVGLENKRLSLELDWTGSKYIIMYPLNARRHSAANVLTPEIMEVPLTKK